MEKTALALVRKYLDGQLPGHTVDFYLSTIDDLYLIQSANPLDEVTDYETPNQITIDLDGDPDRKVIIAQPILTDLLHVFYAEVVCKQWYEPLVFLGEIDPTA